MGTGIVTKVGVCGCDWYKQEQRGDKKLVEEKGRMKTWPTESMPLEE